MPQFIDVDPGNLHLPPASRRGLTPGSLPGRKGPSAMNSQERAELLATLAELSQRYPDWRLGQLVANVAGWADQKIWDIEDEQLLEAAPRAHASVDAGASDADWLNQAGTPCGQPEAAGSFTPECRLNAAAAQRPRGPAAA